MSLNSRLVDSDRHVIGCHSTQETRVQNAFDAVFLSCMAYYDVAITTHQSLIRGVLRFLHVPADDLPRGAIHVLPVPVPQRGARCVHAELHHDRHRAQEDHLQHQLGGPSHRSHGRGLHSSTSQLNLSRF